ncbi:MAG: caspase family protein [Gemmatimonadetes bacterium]|nr:caspase family protein [Gemmatimonadota bacterium]
MAEEIDEWEEVLAEDGYRLIDDSKIGTLNEGASETVRLDLAAGMAYTIVGGCDVDCTDLDLHLTDSRGNEIDIDIDDDDFPMVVTERGGSYGLRVSMVRCSAEPCHWGLGVFASGGGTQNASSTDKRVGGGSFNGVLEAGDATMGSGYMDRHSFRVTAGQRVVADLRASGFDTYLILRQPNGEQWENDDFDGSLDHSRVDLIANETGTWTALVTSYEAGGTGSYELTVSTEESNGGGAVAGLAGARYETGRLARGDDTLRTGEYYDEYSFEGQAGDQVIVDLRSHDFDPYLFMEVPGGEQFDNDDHEGDATRSMLSLTLERGGTVTVNVTSYKPGETGAYDLKIDAGTVSEAVASGSRIERGELAPGDNTLRTLEFADRYEFDALPGQRVTIDLQSSDFDTYVILIDPRGEQEENDDTDRPGHSVIEADITEAGTYAVLVTSYSPEETGSYELRLDFGGESSTPAQGRDVTRIAAGERMTGRLEEGDGELRYGAYRDLFVFEGRQGQQVQIDMHSAEFDTYLRLITPAGDTIRNDDYEGSSAHSRINLPVQQTGRYRIMATSYQAGRTGQYALSLGVSGAAEAGTSRLALGQNTTGGGGRVYGVFAGISEYGGRLNNLAYTAEDAVRMRDAMLTGAGMREQDGILLTNAHATVGEIRRAIRQVASQAGPDDTFVFFYSGHGGRIPRPGGYQSTDPDGLDETLEFYDAGMTDDEFQEVLSEVNAGKIILLLDACFSGGFAKDVISVPGRMGLFSSEEDVTSSVAVKFRAGGFLAVFVADAIAEGLADRDGDGGISAIELSQYVHERYSSDVKSGGPGDFVRTGGPQLGYQHLVVDRGSIGPYEILFRQDQ